MNLQTTQNGNTGIVPPYIHPTVPTVQDDAEAVETEELKVEYVAPELRFARAKEEGFVAYLRSLETKGELPGDSAQLVSAYADEELICHVKRNDLGKDELRELWHCWCSAFEEVCFCLSTLGKHKIFGSTSLIR